MNYPATVPRLQARNICRYTMEFGDARCLLGWLTETFGDVYNPELEELLLNEIRAVTGLYFYDCVVTLNDDSNVGLNQLASAWNNFVRKLGLTTVEPKSG